MACKSCAERRARMKAWLQERFRVEAIHKAAKSRATHRQQAVAGDPGAGTGGTAAVPDMRETGQGGAGGGSGSPGQRLAQQREREPVGAVQAAPYGEDQRRDAGPDVEGEGLQ